ncbi:hypothetical protein COLO4_16152 [Corchorus olitorius]|uniref:Uncharacterized protein n=1 Tax=Corchorus olitorius TaxID=93759 RepID=A0A1R3JJD4_9ROSI|nr:hypothetical protein COLO4_16152 [Corchorus olitorius]
MAKDSMEGCWREGQVSFQDDQTIKEFRRINTYWSRTVRESSFPLENEGGVLIIKPR